LAAAEPERATLMGYVATGDVDVAVVEKTAVTLPWSAGRTPASAEPVRVGMAEPYVTSTGVVAVVVSGAAVTVRIPGVTVPRV
jgi:hypothetical protein